jgi:uncharacterized protein YjbJ (UPF0337 family)
MNDIIKSNWHEVKGKLLTAWGDLTHDEVASMKGTMEELRGLLMKKYGYSKGKVETEIASFAQKHGLE